MTTFSLKYTKYYVAGELRGLSAVETVKYDVYMREKVIKGFERDIKQKKVILGKSGAFIITHIEVEV